MTLRFLLLVWLATLLAPRAAPAQGERQDVGLLLGVRYQLPTQRPVPYFAGGPDSLARDGYRTLLVARRDGRVQVTEAEGLFLPRASGFWRVGVKRSVYNDWVEDFLWGGAAERPPALSGIQSYNGEYCRGHRAQRVLFAGPNYLALDQRTAGYCEGAAHPWNFSTLAVLPLDSLTHPGLGITDVLGTAAWEVFVRSAEQFLRSMPDPDRRARLAELPDEANWGVTRQEGRWVLKGRLDSASEAVQGSFADFFLPLDAPPSLVGHNTLVPEWRHVRAFAPDAVDALSSPSRDLLVIVHPGRITVHPVTQGRIGAAAATYRLPAGARPVLAQWANGPRVQRWNEHLSRPSAARAPY